MRYCFGDIESTGLGKNAGIVEISWIETDDNFNEVARYSSLINPEVPIEFGAMAIHGITEEMVADAPRIDQFMESEGFPLSGPDVVLVAHSASFDIKFFAPWMDAPNTLCTLKCARVLYPDAEAHKLGVLRCMLGLEGDVRKAHSAQEDVSVLIQLAKRMCSDFDVTLADLMKIQNQPRNIKVISFGKHRGKRLVDLPRDYVVWLLTKADNVDPDLRYSLEAL